MNWVTLADRYADDGGHMGGGWAFLMGAFMIIALAALVLLVAWLVGNWPSRTPAGAPSGRERALDILDRRLASGEITPEEYRERAEILHGG